MHPLNAITEPVLVPVEHRAVMSNVARLVAHIERAGYRLSVGNDLAETAPIFARSGEKLAVLADPSIHTGEPMLATTLTLILVDGVTGNPAGCTAIRRVWVEHLPIDMRTLRYWYGDKASLPIGTTCVTPGGWTWDVSRCWTIWSCAFHVDGAAQAAKGVTYALIRIAHALALAKWDWRWLLGRGKEGVAARYPFERYGVDHVSPGLFILGPGEKAQPDHPHYLMGSTRRVFTGQAVHPLYGDPLAKLGVPPALRFLSEVA